MISSLLFSLLIWLHVTSAHVFLSQTGSVFSVSLFCFLSLPQTALTDGCPSTSHVLPQGFLLGVLPSYSLQGLAHSALSSPYIFVTLCYRATCEPTSLTSDCYKHYRYFTQLFLLLGLYDVTKSREVCDCGNRSTRPPAA